MDLGDLSAPRNILILFDNTDISEVSSLSLIS
jgi:hypothetical protein